MRPLPNCLIEGNIIYGIYIGGVRVRGGGVRASIGRRLCNQDGKEKRNAGPVGRYCIVCVCNDFQCNGEGDDE